MTREWKFSRHGKLCEYLKTMPRFTVIMFHPFCNNQLISLNKAAKCMPDGIQAVHKMLLTEQSKATASTESDLGIVPGRGSGRQNTQCTSSHSAANELLRCSA